MITNLKRFALILGMGTLVFGLLQIPVTKSAAATSSGSLNLLTWRCTDESQHDAEAKPTALHVEARRLGRGFDYDRTVEASPLDEAMVARISLPEGIYTLRVGSRNCGAAGVVTVFNNATSALAVLLQRNVAQRVSDVYSKPVDSLVVTFPFAFSYVRLRGANVEEAGACRQDTCTWELIPPGKYSVIIGGPNWTSSIPVASLDGAYSVRHVKIDIREIANHMASR